MDLKEKILESIKYAREKLNYTLISEDWGLPARKCTCAMGCVLLKDNPKDLDRVRNESAMGAAKVLGVNEAWVDAFIDGFDGHGTADESKVSAAWTLGLEVRQETKPVNFHDFFLDKDGVIRKQ